MTESTQGRKSPIVEIRQNPVENADFDGTYRILTDFAVAEPEIRFTPSAKLMGYLRLLVRETMLGRNPNAVAEHLLTIAAERRFLEGYHTKVVPTADAGPSEKA